MLSIFSATVENSSLLKGAAYGAYSGSLTLVERCVIDYAKKIGRLSLADVVIDVYDSSLEESSRSQYATGQRAYIRFVNSLHSAQYLLPFPKTPLRNTELSLAFFMASLLLKPSIKVAATILSYETHVK